MPYTTQNRSQYIKPRVRVAIGHISKNISKLMELQTAFPLGIQQRVFIAITREHLVTIGYG